MLLTAVVPAIPRGSRLVLQVPVPLWLGSSMLAYAFREAMGWILPLHESGVEVGVLGRNDADTAGRLLHDCCKNEPAVYARRVGDFGDGVLHFFGLGVAVARHAPGVAGGVDELAVGFEPGNLLARQ